MIKYYIKKFQSALSLTVYNQKCDLDVISTKIACFALVFTSVTSTDVD